MKKHLKPFLLSLLIAYAVGEGLKLMLGSDAVTGGHLVVMSVSVFFYLRRYPFPSAGTVKMKIGSIKKQKNKWGTL